MIITQNGRVVAFVGDVIMVAGRVYLCVLDKCKAPKMCSGHCSFFDSSLVCEVMECCPDGRPDGLAVHFVPYGAEEGGEDDNQ